MTISPNPIQAKIALGKKQRPRHGRVERGQLKAVPRKGRSLYLLFH